MVPLRETIFGPVTRLLWLLLGAVALVWRLPAETWPIFCWRV